MTAEIAITLGLLAALGTLCGVALGYFLSSLRK